MRTRDAAWLAAAAALSLGACHRDPRCGPAQDRSVLACVGDDAVRRGEAQEFLRDAEYVAGSARPQDPRALATEKAIRLRLFANEAKRRGLAPAGGGAASVTTLAQALVADEAQKRGISRDTVTEQDARKFYDEHPEAFGQIDEVELQAIVVADPDAAERIYGEAVGADEARFAELVAKHSEDAASKAKRGMLAPIHAERGADRELLKLGLSLRRAGALGGPVKAADGRYYVARVVAAPVSRLPTFDEQARAKAKNIVAFERTEALKLELAESLRKSTSVRTFEDAIAALAPAAAASASKP
jgi:peptidyl-prolyl cis-trans isomerase C